MCAILFSRLIERCKLRDSGDDEVRKDFEAIEKYQLRQMTKGEADRFRVTVELSKDEPGGQIDDADGMAQLRQMACDEDEDFEGYDDVRGVESQSTRRMSFVCDALLGKMTPVNEVTDVGVAFNLKKNENEVRSEKRARMWKFEYLAKTLRVPSRMRKVRESVGGSCVLGGPPQC